MASSFPLYAPPSAACDLVSTAPLWSARALRILLEFSRTAAGPWGALHALAVTFGGARVSANVARAPAGLSTTLMAIWHHRMAREVLEWALSTPLRRAALAIVTGPPPPPAGHGCVIAVCHTPWARVLTEWCHDCGFALTYPGRPRRAGASDRPACPLSLVTLVRRLRDGGQVVVVADHFGGARRCSVRFLGVPRQASTFPARLAACAGVPLQAMLPVYTPGRLRLQPGPRFQPSTHTVDHHATTRALLAFFELRIREQPTQLARFSRLY